MTIDQYDDRRLSETLMETMKVKGLTAAKLSEATGISERIIELFLADRFEELPPAPYVRGYLLKIAEVLGADGEMLWDAYGKFHAAIRRAGQKDMLPENRFALPKVSRKFILGAGLAVIIIGFIASRFLFGGQAFVFEVNVGDNLIVATSTYLLEGRIRTGDQLTVNGVPLTLENDGTFVYALDLREGFTPLRFVVTRPLEGERVFEKRIFYEVPASIPQF
jgi:hypothetical protein